MPRCFIGLGGNVGDVQSTLRQALHTLEQARLHVVRCSRFFDTTPVGSVAGQRYLNAAAELNVAVSPQELLALLQQIEHSAGRVRAERWGPRTLDLDLLLCGDLVIRSEMLTLPHPAMWCRRFVLDPLVEMGREVIHPVLGRTIGELRDRLLRRPLPVHLAGDTVVAAKLVADLQSQFGRVVEWTDNPDCAAVIFTVSPVIARLPPQTIDLAAAPDPTSMARAVLTAVLDEPRPVADV